MTDMEPVQFLTTPPYSSPEGEGEGLRMVPVDDNPAEGATTTEAPADDADKRASDWVAEIEGASTQEELDAILERYEATGKDFATVNSAAEAKQAALDAS